MLGLNGAIMIIDTTGLSQGPTETIIQAMHDMVVRLETKEVVWLECAGRIREIVGTVHGWEWLK